MTAAEKKKLTWLGILGGPLLMYSIYTNFLSGPSVPGGSASAHSATADKNATGAPFEMEGATPKKAARSRAAGHGRTDEFHPVYLSNRPEERPDPTKIDPMLKLDLFAKVQEVDPAGGKRNLFAFGQPPPPPPKEVVQLPKGPETHVPLGPGGKPAAAPPPVAPVDLPLRTNLKYYGIVALSRGGQKTACFLDTDEEILLASEGETLKRRYRVTKISTTSVVVQDTESKKEEVIPLAQEAKGS
jgi:hypothetical protein